MTDPKMIPNSIQPREQNKPTELEKNKRLPRVHIENRRLYNMAVGQFKFQEWEQDHLRDCDVCQGVLWVLLNQPIGTTTGNDEKPAHDAA
jgi:hypothetical protein